MTDQTPVLRLTGEQLGSIDPPVSGDWFVDFDEYEEFVPKRMLDAALASPEHMGRSWDGHPLEDACPCPVEACGLVSSPDPACEQHGHSFARTMRQGHRASDCPAAEAAQPAPLDEHEHSWEWTDWMEDQSRVVSMVEWCRTCHVHRPALDERYRKLVKAARRIVYHTDVLVDWDETNGYVVNSERDALAGDVSAAWVDFRAALAALEDSDD